MNAPARGGVPRVSVGLPVYNGAHYVERSLESILAQDMPDLEVIVSDNASTDGTLAICEKIAARDARVRVVSQPQNRGGAWNFNEVYRQGRAPFFKWASHDDWCAPTYLRRCLEVFEQSGPSVVLVYPHTVLVGGADELIGRYEDRLELRGARPYRRIAHLTRWLSLCNAVQGLIRRSALERTRLHGAYPGSDQILLAELALLGEFREVPEPLFFRRRHADSSRIVNTTAAQITAWFDPNALPATHPRLRLHRENLAAIARSPHGAVERARCVAAYLGVYFYRRARVGLGGMARQWLRRSGATRTHKPAAAPEDR